MSAYLNIHDPLKISINCIICDYHDTDFLCTQVGGDSI